MAGAVRVLVVDDEENLRHMLGLALSKDGHHVWTAGSGHEALEVLGGPERFDVCVTDVRMPGMDGLVFVEKASRLPEAPTLIAMSAYGDEALAIEALRRGAFDYMRKPFEPADLSLKLKLLSERRRLGQARKAGDAKAHPLPSQPGRRPVSDSEGSASSRGEVKQPPGLDQMVSVAPRMRRVFETVKKVASFPTTVLITGETGTGKERIAGAIHFEGRRRNRPFVAVNCGAIPEALLESELFGHVKGAFTDASQTKIGLFELADGGTLFLDEIAELPVSLQVKLLRVLVDHELRPVGGTSVREVDVRVIAATSRDLEVLVADGRFREDLFYRLAVVSIHLPPLRERREDVPALISHFKQAIASRLELSDPVISDEAMKVLADYDWPGNVRELENAIERALVLSDHGGRLTIADLDERFDSHGAPEEDMLRWVERLDDLSVKLVLPQVERGLIRAALARTQGNRTQAATVLGISQRALLYKLKDYGLK